MKAYLFGAASAPVIALCAFVPAALAQATTNPNAPLAQPQAPVAQGDTTTQGTAGVAAATGDAQGEANTIQTVVVTGSTSKRTLLNASVAITNTTQLQLQEAAPRSTADALTTVPGIVVASTAGPVSNNYAVRGLPGGGSTFVRLEEDGMPEIYGNLNDDEVFQYDISIDHLEAIEGGTSGILTENAAGASINFISRPLNFDTGGGLIRASGTTYGDGRGDFWYSAPIKALGDGVAFAISGYYDNSPGVRDSQFRYGTYHLKGQFEKKFNSGGYVKFMYKRWDEHDAYYADQPYSYQNGQIGGVPSLGTQFGNIIGSDFGRIVVPDSCFANQCTRTFSEQDGIHEQGDEYRVDFEKPVTSGLSVFAKVRYTQTNFDFNGVFAGSGTGNGGLTSATNYLNPGVDATGAAISPIQSLLQMGQAAFPTATQFGIRNVATGAVIPESNAAALNALNGNGLLEQTVLNRQFVKLHDWGSDFGFRWNISGNDFSNSLTAGGMVFSQSENNDQSGVSAVLNDVTTNSNIYDVVALNNAGSVLGSLTNNGLLSYGDWGQGIFNQQLDSQSAYVNDEFTFANRLHIDAGLRYEHEHVSQNVGGSAALPVPATYPGLIRTNPNAFDGTYTNTSGSENPLNWTVGANYTITPRLSVYARYAKSYQTQGVNSDPIGLKLVDGGVTFADFGFLGKVEGFRTEYDNYSGGGGVDPANPNLTEGFFANLIADGMDLDITYRPTFERFHAFSMQAQATYQSSTFNNVNTGVIETGGQNIAQQLAAFYNGKTAALTPNWQFMLEPSYDLPNGFGTVYLRYYYEGAEFADNGNALALPAYGTLAIGGLFNITHNMQFSVNVQNVTNALGLTEGNPRQGFTQSIVSGYFYGRGIIGPNAQFALTYKF
jgi:iron complex outermembrane receptor protein